MKNTLLRISTLNTRGLLNNKKRSKIFRYIHNFRSSIFCLQETHSQPEHHNQFHQQIHAHQSFWTPHVSIISFSETIHLSNLTIINDRAIKLDVAPTDENAWNTDKFSLLSIYAPASRSERKT